VAATLTLEHRREPLVAQHGAIDLKHDVEDPHAAGIGRAARQHLCHPVPRAIDRHAKREVSSSAAQLEGHALDGDRCVGQEGLARRQPAGDRLLASRLGGQAV